MYSNFINTFDELLEKDRFSVSILKTPKRQGNKQSFEWTLLANNE